MECTNNTKFLVFVLKSNCSLKVNKKNQTQTSNIHHVFADLSAFSIQFSNYEVLKTAALNLGVVWTTAAQTCFAYRNITLGKQ